MGVKNLPNSPFWKTKKGRRSGLIVFALVVLIIIVSLRMGSDERGRALASGNREAGGQHSQQEVWEATRVEDPKHLEVSGRLDDLKDVYNEMWDFRMRPDFQESGLLSQSLDDWNNKVSDLREDRALNSELTRMGLEVSDLFDLVNSWKRNNGYDDETSSRLVRKWDSELGLRHALNQVDFRKAEYMVGSWRILDSPIISRITINKSERKFQVTFVFVNGKITTETAKVAELESGAVLLWDGYSGDRLFCSGTDRIVLADSEGVVARGAR